AIIFQLLAELFRPVRRQLVQRFLPLLRRHALELVNRGRPGLGGLAYPGNLWRTLGMAAHAYPSPSLRKDGRRTRQRNSGERYCEDDVTPQHPFLMATSRICKATW